MEKNKNIVFRRIRGRIVPIKTNKDSNITPKLAGGALVGAGAAASIFSGKKAYGFLRKAADVENRAFTISKLASRTGQMGLFSQARHFAPGKLHKLSGRLFRARNLSIFGGAAIGGALITAGARLVSKQDKELSKDENVKKFTTVAGGFGAGTFLANLAYRRRVNPAEALKKAVQYAKNRNIFKYIVRGI